MFKILAFKKLAVLSVFFMSFASYGEEKTLESKKWKLWEEEKLKVRHTFPQYKKNFNHKAIQEKVYQELFPKTETKNQKP